MMIELLFSFCDLPEITGDALADEMHEVGLTNDDEPFWKQYRCIFGWCAFSILIASRISMSFEHAGSHKQPMCELLTRSTVLST